MQNLKMFNLNIEVGCSKSYKKRFAIYLLNDKHLITLSIGFCQVTNQLHYLSFQHLLKQWMPINWLEWHTHVAVPTNSQENMFTQFPQHECLHTNKSVSCWYFRVDCDIIPPLSAHWPPGLYPWLKQYPERPDKIEIESIYPSRGGKWCRHHL